VTGDKGRIQLFKFLSQPLVSGDFVDCRLSGFVFEDQLRRVSRVVEKVQRVQQLPVQSKQVAQRARKPTPNIMFRDVVPTAVDAVANAQQDQLAQSDRVASKSWTSFQRAVLHSSIL